MGIDPILTDTFYQLNEEFKIHSVKDGTAANVILLTDTHIFCANAGDSRSILIRNGKPIALSTDHKPENDDERKRIESEGGFVTCKKSKWNSCTFTCTWRY